MDDALSCFLKEIETDSSDLAKQIHSFLSLYSPLPDQLSKYADLINHRPVLGKGRYSIVYDSGDIQTPHALLHLATKTPLTRKSNKTELLLNMVVINRLLLQGIGMGHLIPTYGYFVCEAQRACIGYQMVVPNPLKPRPMDGYPHIVMVQQRIDGHPLHHYLVDEPAPLHQVKNYIIQVMTVLMWLEASPYRFYHNDLHDHNILISNGRAYIIDMDFAECTIGDTRTQLSPSKRQYCGSREKAAQLYSGAYDVYLLLTKLLHSHHNAVYNWAVSKLHWFWEKFGINRVPARYKDPWLYAILTQLENRLLEPTRTDVHQYNMDMLCRMSYDYLAGELFPDEQTHWTQVREEIHECDWSRLTPTGSKDG
jgi:serine/threonine protein kinase